MLDEKPSHGILQVIELSFLIFHIYIDLINFINQLKNIDDYKCW